MSGTWALDRAPVHIGINASSRYGRRVPLVDSLRIVAKTLAASLPTALGALTGKLTPELASERIDDWSRAIVERADLRLHVTGADGVDWRRSYVIMSNHQSHLDIPVLYRVLPPSVRMVAKSELFKIPIFGTAMRGAGFVEIDRGDRRKAIASLEAAAERVRAGTSVWIAPEGTRSADGQIGPLKKGGFMLARQAQVPIMPVAVNGTRRALAAGKASIRLGQDVQVHVGEPIPTADTSVEDLMRQVRDFLVEHTSQA
jgi:1-acyl-sn-glycerol-3-phosphate acyltransferase